MKKLFLALLITSLFTGCLKNSENTFTCNYNDCGLVAPAAEIDAVRNYLSSNNITATQHCSGLFYIIDEQGTGTRPTVCNTIAFTYEGRLTNGNVFDEASSPVVYPLTQLISGFKNGIPLVRAGGKIRLFVPPTLGYGSNQAGSIPPNSILIFNVTLTGVQ